MATLGFGTGGAGASINQGFPSVQRNPATTNFTSLQMVNFGEGTTQTPFLPETLDKQVKRFGNRSISGLLSKMAAEYALQSDKIQWTEQNRLHIKSVGITKRAVTGTGTNTNAREFTFPSDHGFRVGQTIILVQTSGVGAGREHKGRVRAAGTGTNGVIVDSYAAESAGFDGGFPGFLAGTTTYTAITYGSEFAKGTIGMEGSLDVTYVNRSNEPIIMKDKYSVTGSDVAQIGWIEVQDVNGDGGHGFLWYLQSEMDERARFMDDLEVAMVEAVPAHDDSPAAGLAITGDAAFGAGSIRGTRGLFYELEQYGNTFTNGFNDATAKAGLADFDLILKQLDTQGNIEENMLYLNREQTLKLDNILGQQSDYGGTGGGPSWGSFANSKSMALDLGFDGWRRGSYDFYKTDWKYLNDTQKRRDIGVSSTASNIHGIMVPGGSSSVYDEMLSSTIKRPMLHVRYRAAQGENRKLKNWVTGSVGGVYTSDADRMDVHYLSERCLVVQAANNFAIFKQS